MSVIICLVVNISSTSLKLSGKLIIITITAAHLSCYTI